MSAISLISLLVVLIAINFKIIATNEKVFPTSLNESELSSLRAVYIMMRHGIRSSQLTYPLDPFANEFNSRYPNGKAQLTDRGIEQAYNMGKFIKSKYNNFLKNKKKMAFLRASPVQRCIDTLSIVVKKIWPPEVDDKKSWQPTIFMLPKHFDRVLFEGIPCKAITDAKQNNLKTQEVKDYESDPKIQGLYNFTAEKTGLPPNMNSVLSVFDCIESAKHSGLPLPDWTTPDFLEQIGDFYSHYSNFIYGSTNLQRFVAGPILGDYVTKMENIINRPGDKPKNVFLYGTHESKISAVLNSLGDSPSKYTPFLSTIIFELHRIGGKHIVRANYIDNTTNDWPFNGIKLELTKCKQRGTNIGSILPRMLSSGIIENDQECTFENFAASVAHLTTVEWSAECCIDWNPDPIKIAENDLGDTK